MKYRVYTLDNGDNETTNDFRTKSEAIENMKALIKRQELGWGYIRIALFDTYNLIQINTNYDINE